MKKQAFLSHLLGFSSQALAQPVDKNQSILYMEFGGKFGQSTFAGRDGSADAALGSSAGSGYVLKRDTWNRIEMGLAVGTDCLGYKPSGDDAVELDKMPNVLLRIGYGYSQESHAFGVFRAGVGIGAGTYEVVGQSSDVNSVITSLGWDAVIPTGGQLDFVSGLEIRSYNVGVDDIQGESVDGFQVNVPAAYAKLRIKIWTVFNHNS